MYKTPMEAKAFIEELAPLLGDKKAYLAVPYTALVTAADAAKGTGISVGAQNLSEHGEGAYTGEISGKMIFESGATFTLIGHSERRQYYGETNGSVRAKVERAIKCGLTPVMCIGETLAEREQGDTAAVLKTQIAEGLNGFEPKELEALVVAYEPVWAIGTGKSATPQLADETHSVIRNQLEAMRIDPLILYGGSVKPTTIKELMAMDRIDGALVGGASLDVKSFYQIIEG